MQGHTLYISTGKRKKKKLLPRHKYSMSSGSHQNLGFSHCRLGKMTITVMLVDAREEKILFLAARGQFVKSM